MRHFTFQIWIATAIIFSASCGVSNHASSSGKDSVDVRNLHGISTKSDEQIKLESLIIDGQKAEFEGNDDVAITNYKEAADNYNENATANYYLARIYYQEHNYALAEAAIIKAVEHDPTNEWMLLLEAEIFDAQNNFSKAAEVYQRIIELNPDNLENYYSLAFEFSQSKNYEEAIKIYDQIETKNGVDEQLSIEKQKLYNLLQKPDKAIAELQKLVNAFPQTPKYYALLADAYSQNNQPDLAMATIQQLVKIDPNNPQAQLALFNYYKNNGNFTQAFIALKNAFQSVNLDADTKIGLLVNFLPFIASDVSQRNQAIELADILVHVHSDNAKAFSVQGDLLVRANELNAAVDAFKNSLRLDESRYNVWQQLIGLYSIQKQNDSMLYYAQKANQLFPEQLTSYIMYGAALQNNKQYHEALSAFSMAAAIGSDDNKMESDIYKSLGDCYHQLNKNSLSDSCYNLALAAYSSNIYVLNNYAYFLAQRNERLNDALAMAQKLNQLQPSFANYEDTYAWVLFKLKRYTEAKAWIEKCMQHATSISADMYDHYGDILFMNNDVAGAVANWQRAKDGGLKSNVIDKKIADKTWYE